ncbi:MAG: hypothetical protein WBB19_18730 [Desulforhopalus sp.]
MEFRTRIAKTGILLCLSIVMVCAVVLSVQAEVLSAGQLVRWQLTDTKVRGGGQTVSTDDGVLIEGYLIEATATAIGDAPVSEGEFQLTASFFKPRLDMPGRESGTWYMQGVWTITDLKTDLNTLEVKHNNAKVKGIITGGLSFDPTSEPGNIKGDIQWPLTLIGTHWAQGEGVFNGSATFEGQIDMTLLRWQKVN